MWMYIYIYMYICISIYIYKLQKDWKGHALIWGVRIWRSQEPDSFVNPRFVYLMTHLRCVLQYVLQCVLQYVLQCVLQCVLKCVMSHWIYETSGGPGRACTNLSWSAKKESRALNNLNRPSDTKSLSNPCSIIESCHFHEGRVLDFRIFFMHEIFFET